MNVITIRHTLETGTVVYGTGKGDGTGSIIRGAGFRPSHQLDDHESYGSAYWYVASTRRRPAKIDYIERCAADLEAAGYQVTIEIDNTTLPTTEFAALEQERYDRAEDRTQRFDGYAEGATAKGQAMIDQAREERSRIPLGQPHLIGHHSYNRTVNAERKRNAKEARGFEHVGRGKHWAGRADAAATFQTGREDLGTTLRRIERLEAQVRGHRRYLTGRSASGRSWSPPTGATTTARPCSTGWRTTRPARSWCPAMTPRTSLRCSSPSVNRPGWSPRPRSRC
jgi:hypothetical protein